MKRVGMRLALLLFLFTLTPCLLLGAEDEQPAGEADHSVVITVTNRLDEEIVSIRVRYASAYEDAEPRHTFSQVFLPPGAGDWRTGVQGVTLPERIIIDLATKSYDFTDLSGLHPAAEMLLEVRYDDGRPLLRRADGEGGAVQGTERAYLTPANRPNAVDRVFLTNLATWEGVAELVRATIADARGGEEELDSSDIEETVFTEDDGWGRTEHFPVFWKDWVGAARVQAMDKDSPDEGIGFDLRFRIPENGIKEMADSLLSDLRVDGFRPWHFAMETWDEEKGERDRAELVFHEGDGDKCDDQDAMQEILFAAYAARTLDEASVTWIKAEAYDAAKGGGEPSAAPGVMVMFSKGTFEAVFVPDGRILMQ